MKLDRLLGYDYPTMVEGQRLFHETPGEGEPVSTSRRVYQVEHEEEAFVVSDCQDCGRPYGWRLSVERGPSLPPEEAAECPEHISREWVCMCGTRNSMQHLPRPSLEEFVAEMEIGLCAHGCAEVPVSTIRAWMDKLKEAIQNSR